MNPAYILGALSQFRKPSSEWNAVHTFGSNILAGDWSTIVGSTSPSWVSSEEAVQYSNFGYNADYSKHTASYSVPRPCTFEFDVELVADSVGLLHYGVVLFDADANDLSGYRIANYQNEWRLDVVSGMGGIGGNGASTQTTLGTHPAFSLPSGVMTVRVEINSSSITIFVNNTPIGSANDSSYSAFKPGLFVYGSTIKCSEIRSQHQPFSVFTFDAPIQSGDWTKRLGSGNIDWLGAQNAIRYTFTSAQEGNYACFNTSPVLQRPFIAEWDVEVSADWWGNMHFGILLLNASNSDISGYRLANFGSNWYYDKMVGQTSVVQSAFGAHAGYPIPTGLLTLRVVATADRLELYLNGVLLSAISDTTFVSLRPGIMHVGCEMHCHEIRVMSTT